MKIRPSSKHLKARPGRKQSVTDKQITSAHREYVQEHKSLPTCADLAGILKISTTALYRRTKIINLRRARKNLPRLRFSKFYGQRAQAREENDRQFVFAYIAHVTLHKKLPILDELGRNFNITRERARQILGRINSERTDQGLPPLETLGYVENVGRAVKVTDEQIIQAHQEHVKTHGKPPTCFYLREKFGINNSTAYARLSQINERRKDQGLSPLTLSTRERPHKVSGEQFIHAYLALILTHQKLPSVDDLCRVAGITHPSVIGRLRRINKKREAEGLDPLRTIGRSKKHIPRSA